MCFWGSTSREDEKVCGLEIMLFSLAFQCQFCSDYNSRENDVNQCNGIYLNLKDNTIYTGYGWLIRKKDPDISGTITLTVEKQLVSCMLESAWTIHRDADILSISMTLRSILRALFGRNSWFSQWGDTDRNCCTHNCNSKCIEVELSYCNY